MSEQLQTYLLLGTLIVVWIFGMGALFYFLFTTLRDFYTALFGDLIERRARALENKRRYNK